jgi:hypothetical protein
LLLAAAEHDRGLRSLFNDQSITFTSHFNAGLIAGHGGRCYFGEDEEIHNEKILDEHLPPDARRKQNRRTGDLAMGWAVLDSVG